MSSRETILGRIRSALTDVPASETGQDVPVPRAYDRTLPESIDPVALLIDRLTDYKATVRRCATADLAATVRASLTGRGVRTLVVPGGTPPNWTRAMEQLMPEGIEQWSDTPPLSTRQLDSADGVLTGCALAVAQTGTIVLDAGPAQGRRALSLLPDYHLCVVGVGQIVGTVPEALAKLDPLRPLTWISGPSATSDIELIRVEGVHGPRTLDVIVHG